MRITNETKVLLGMGLITLFFLTIGVFLFSRPVKPLARERLIVPDTYTRGATDANVFLVEFSDFQCPACRAFKPIVDELVTNYSDRLVFAYRHFPLSQHPFGYRAALAAEVAGVQGKFWEMYDFLFANQDRLSDEVLLEGVRGLGLDSDTFKKEYTQETYKDKVLRDQTDGNAFGITGTPAFFLNGTKLTLKNPEDLKRVVENALQ